MPVIKKQKPYFAEKGPSSQNYGFSSSHVWMWELNHKESSALNNWCFFFFSIQNILLFIYLFFITIYFYWITVVLKETVESPLDCKEIKPVHPKGNQSWIFIGRTNAKAKAPVLWPPDGKNQLTGKDGDAGKDWRREEKGTTEDEMVGWHCRLSGHEFE